MPRRLIGKITLEHEYVNLEASGLSPGPVALPKYGEGADYFKGVKPSDLKLLDNRQLYLAFNRVCLTLDEGRGTKEELDNALDACAAIIREAKSRRTTLHD
jgi:hypothetical protein